MSAEINTLQEFLTHTKAVTYLVAVLGLFGYVWFWLFLVDRDIDEDDEPKSGH